MGKVETNKKQKNTTLLQTSFELFTEKGFTKTTISDIVNRAGLAKGTFYLYFKDKYDLRDRLVTYKTSQLFGNAHTALIEQNIQGFENQMFFVIDHIIDRLEKEPKLLQFISKNLSWAHENDSESAPDTTPADELIKEVRKAMQSPGDRIQEFLEIFCKAFQLKYKRLTDEERVTLKRLFKRSPLIKNSGINFRRRPWK